MNNEALIKEAKDCLNPVELSQKVTAEQVACVLITDRDTLYRGVCIDAACGLGFCAETNAIGVMITGGESRIQKICAVKSNGVVSPCGRCRELML